MKRIWLVLLVALFTMLVQQASAAERIPADGSSQWVEFHGSRLLLLDETNMTDAAPTLTFTVQTKYTTDLVVDVTMDKGGNVIVYPILDVDDTSVQRAPSTTTTIAPGGGTGSAIYTKISAPYAKVVITKTEAGSTTNAFVSIRGLQQ